MEIRAESQIIEIRGLGVSAHNAVQSNRCAWVEPTLLDFVDDRHMHGYSEFTGFNGG